MTLREEAFCLLLLCLLSTPLFASTWYVRPDGGTRYSTGMTKGQCDGTADARYPGSGTNRHCAFKDVQSLWQDGSYASGSVFPAWGWIGKGGDTYLIHGSIGTGVSYRIGYPNASGTQDPASGLDYGIAGDPYGSGMPAPPSGTPAQHTRILGENYASCHAPGAKTQLHGGYGTSSVITMDGASYVDLACLDVTDFSSCGRSAQSNGCNSNVGSLSDYANTGISWSNKSTNDTLTDIHIHGLASSGMTGPTGTGMHFSYLDIIGNAAAGWNADNGTTGSGSLLVDHFNISWNGCAEEYPLKDPLPYNDCTDDNSGGYGDGFGTATKESNPAWHVTFDQGVASYNTQDGLDALHIYGAGSTMTVSHTLAYGNMGQQIKVGGAAGIITDNQIVTNCNAMRQKIPGTPPGYNKKLSDFCRAADAGIAVTVNNDGTLVFDSNTIYSATITTIEVDCAVETCGSSAKVDFRNNVYLGFENSKANGYANGGRDEDSNFVYIGPKDNPFKNQGSIISGNVAYYPNDPSKSLAEGMTKAAHRNPHLVDETWHLYGYGDMSPAAGSPAATGAPASESDTGDGEGRGFPGKRVAACFCGGILAVALWRGLRSRQDT